MANGFTYNNKIRKYLVVKRLLNSHIYIYIYKDINLSTFDKTIKEGHIIVIS